VDRQSVGGLHIFDALLLHIFPLPLLLPWVSQPKSNRFQCGISAAGAPSSIATMLSREETQPEHLLPSFASMSTRIGLIKTGLTFFSLFLKRGLLPRFSVGRIGHIRGTYDTTPSAEEAEVETEDHSKRANSDIRGSPTFVH
jgi:hypothetical protein